MKFGLDSSAESSLSSSPDGEDDNEIKSPIPALHQELDQVHRPIRRPLSSSRNGVASLLTPSTKGFSSNSFSSNTRDKRDGTLPTYSPTPIKLENPNQPKLRGKGRRGLILPITGSSDESFEEEEEEEEEDEDDEDDEEYDSDDVSGGENVGEEREDSEDSEEDEWPVGPIGSIGLGGWRKASIATNKGRRNVRHHPLSSPETIYGQRDDFEIWDHESKAKGWAAANKSFHLSLARAVQMSPPARPSSTTSSFSSTTNNDMSSIQSLLSSLALAQSASQAELVKSFESRNAALWTSIEDSIRQAEKEEGEKQRALEENRKKREEAERKAREMREMEVKKAEEEKRVRKEAAERRQKEAEAIELREKEKQTKKAEELQQTAFTTPQVVEANSGEQGSPQQEWEKWTAKMTHIKQTVLPAVSTNPTWRKACFNSKRAITPKIGQLTASASAISRIISQLDELLNSMRAPQGTNSNEPYLWTLNHLSKALVKQAEQEVTAKVGTAYPLARVVIGLLTRGHTDLGSVLMARLVKKCFWITGYWPKKQPNQSDEDHQKSLGHAPPNASESLVQYASRMSGLIALYAAIVQTSPLQPPQGPCPSAALANVPAHFRPSAAWRWLVLILRPPLVGLEPTPLLLITFLEVAGAGLCEIFGRQMHKFIEVLVREGVRENKAGFSDKAKSSRVRLLLWLEDWEKKGRAEAVEGREVDP